MFLFRKFIIRDQGSVLKNDTFKQADSVKIMYSVKNKSGKENINSILNTEIPTVN